jgi:GT2 family glycosyltransferase
MRKLTVAILVTNYNTWDLVGNCVEACYLHDEGRFDRLFIYDDCSETDCSVSFPATTHVYRGAKNIGLTRALNAAFELISEDIVVLFDSDAYPTTAFCEELRVMFEANHDLGLVGMQTVGTAGCRTESYTSEPNVWTLLLGQKLYAKTEKFLKDKSGHLSVFTCAMAVRRAAFVELGGFDANFDWLDLDHDLSMRVNRSHWQIAIAPEARVFHEGSGTHQLTRNRVRRFYKTRWYLLEKFGRLPCRALVKSLILVRLCAEYLILLGLGQVIIRDRVRLSDKVEGRRELIGYCFRNY